MYSKGAFHAARQAVRAERKSRSEVLLRFLLSAMALVDCSYRFRMYREHESKITKLQ